MDESTLTSTGVGSALHPLDPLTDDEVGQAARILGERQGLDDQALFVEIALLEPEKDELARHEAGVALTRKAAVVVLDRGRHTTYEAVVSVTDGTVVAWSEIPGVQPMITLDEYDECQDAVRADPKFRAALAQRGIDDPAKVMVEAWTVGGHADRSEAGRRLAWTPCWYRETLDDNAYSRPIEGLYAIVDLNAMEILRVENETDVPIPPASGAYAADQVGRLERTSSLWRSHSPTGPASISTGTVFAGRTRDADRVHAPRGPCPAHALLL